MMEIKMARKRTGTPVDPAFALFQSGAPEWREEPDQNTDQTTQNKGTEAGGYDVAMKALQEQISLLRDMQTRNSRTSSALMSQTAVDQAPRVITEMSLENLPDPVTDPQGYAREIAKRGQEMLVSQRNYDAWAQGQANRQAQAYNGVWEKFAKDHPEYAAHEKLVESAATSVINAAKARNLDVSKLITGDTDNFLEDVMKEMRDIVGGDTLFQKEDDGNDDGSLDASSGADDGRALEADEDEDPDRTAGVFGGQDSGGRPNPSAKPVDADMFKDIREFQQKNGWHI